MFTKQIRKNEEKGGLEEGKKGGREEGRKKGKSNCSRQGVLDILFLFKFIYLFIYFWLCWVFVSARGLSLVAASGDHSSSRCAGLSLSRPLVAEHRLQTRRLSSCGSRA